MNWYWIVIIVLALLGIIYLGIGLYFFLYTCKPNRDIAASLNGGPNRTLNAYTPFIKEKAKQNSPLKHENVSCKAFDGKTLRAKLYPGNDKDRFLILVHGFQSSIFWDFAASFEWYVNSGCSVLALENRAHGSDGTYIGFGVLEQRDVHSWMEWLIERYGEDIRIGLSGVSMGGATVMMASGNYPVDQLKCVIEDCGYCYFPDVLYHKIKMRNIPPRPLIPVGDFWSRILAGYSFYDASPEKAVAKSHVPTLFIHGTADTFVPYWMMDRVYSACSAPKEKATFMNAIHGEASFLEPDRYKELVIGFLDRNL